MDHGYFKDRISAYLDGDLPPYEEQAMAAHLEECEECRTLLEKLRQVERLVEDHSGLNGDEYFEQLAQKIERRIGGGQEEPEVTDVSGPGRSGLVWKLTAAAASVAVLVFIGLHQTDILDMEESVVPAAGQAVTEKDKVRDTLAEQAVSPTGGETGVPAREDYWLRHEADSVQAAPAKVEKTSVDHDGRHEPKSTADNGKPTAAMGDSEKSPAITPPESLEHEIVEEMKRRTAREPEQIEPEPAVLAEQADVDMDTPALPVLQPVDSLQQRVSDDFSAAPAYAPAIRLNPRGRVQSLDQSTALEAGEGAGGLDLAGWKSRRDSLQTQWAELTSAHRKLSLGKARGDSSLAGIDLIERQLLEAQYNVGRLAAGTDPEELEAVRDFFRRYLERPDARYREVARQYYDLLHGDEQKEK